MTTTRTSWIPRPRLPRWVSRRKIMMSLAVVALLWNGGDGRPMAQAAQHKPKAWFDAKGAFVFALGEGSLPATRDQLTDSLTEGWKTHLRFPEGGDLVHVEGGRYPAIGSLHVQLGGGITKPPRDEDTKKNNMHPSGKVEGRLTVRDFDLDARPLVTEKAKLDIHVAATDARFDLEHDEWGRPLMMMSDAKSASLQFHATNADLERILALDLNQAAQKYGVSIQKVKLKIEAVNNRSIDVDLHVSTKVAFVPAGMHFHAHVDIDNDMYAKLSSLKCDGDDAIGPLIVGLIRPGLSKYEGKSRLVFSFPTGQLKLRDVNIQGGDEVKIAAMFER